MVSGRCAKMAAFFERAPKFVSFSTLTSMLFRSFLIFLSVVHMFIVMSNLTVETLEEIHEEKLQKVIQPLLICQYTVISS